VRNVLARIVSKVSKSLLVLAGTVIATAQVQAQPAERLDWIDPARLPRFEVASIKPSPVEWRVARTEYPPGGFVQQNQILGDTLGLAFDVSRDRIVGAPEWIWRERFSIDGRMPPTKRPSQDRLLMVRALFIDRFRLQYHVEHKDADGYVLTVAREDGRLGPQLGRSNANCSNRRLDQDKTEVGDDCTVLFSYGLIDAHGIPLTILRNIILGSVDRFVIVSPNLAGDFDLKLQFTPTRPGVRLEDRAASADGGTNVYTALREQLGLRLEPAKITVDHVVIDHIERPAEN